MLKHLLIKNYALIAQLELEPATSLNIITGETGAGKSIMLGAIGLLLGNRADSKSLYNEAQKCVIEGTFDLSPYQLDGMFAKEELDYLRETVLRREISPAGKSRAFINDTPVTLNVMKRFGETLLDIHSQHETLALGTQEFQLQIIDNFGQHHKALAAYQHHYQAYSQAQKTLQQLQEEAQHLQREHDFNVYQLEELANAKLQEGEQETLEQEQELMQHAELIKTNLVQVSQLLAEGEYAVNSTLYTAKASMEQIAPFSDQYKQAAERLDSAFLELKDLAEETERQAESVEFDPARVEFVNDRLSLIYQLQKKHLVDSVKGLQAIQEELETKVNKVNNLDEALQEAQNTLKEAEGTMMHAGQALTKQRQKQMPLLAKSMVGLLQDLGMPNAQFTIEHNAITPAPTGLDAVEYLFSANKGMAPQPLKAVASGGEFSRLMFALKYLLADKTAMPTIIFDEIDTGISGEIALKMGQMMQKMAQSHQVITISHLPQVAARGQRHYFVYKDDSAEKTESKIRELNPEERIVAIAKMIGGDTPPASAYESAKELLVQ